jgi:hypothetical protein
MIIEREMRYRIINRKSVRLLEQDLCQHIDARWRLHGSLFQAGEFYCQAVISVARIELNSPIRHIQTNFAIISDPLIWRIERRVQARIDSKWRLNGPTVVIGKEICQPVAYLATVAADLEG